MKESNSEAFIRKRSKFKIESTNKEYNLRPLNLEDELWIDEIFNGKTVADLVQEANITAITKIVYRLIENREDFVERQVTIVDENGVSKDMKLGGLKLMRIMMQGGVQEQVEMFRSLLETVGFSRPMQEKAEKAEKKRTLQQHHHDNHQHIGPQSSIDSVSSTDGQLSTYSAEPQEKLQSD